MSYIHITHRHLLNREEARARVEQIAGYLKKRYRINYSWKEFQLISHHKGCTIILKLQNQRTEIRLKLGMLLSPMRGKIEKALRTNLRGVFGDRKGVPGRIELSEKL